MNKYRMKGHLFAIALIAMQSTMATAAQNRYHDEESGKSYIVPTRPLTVIESQNIYKALDKGVALPVEFKAPTHWSVRAIYVRTNNQLLEFSKSGEIVYDSTDPDGRHQTDTYAMRQIFVRGKPVWKNAHVFQRVSSSAERDINYGLALIPLGLVYSNNGNVCPVRDIDPILHQRPSPRGAPRYTLDGTCSGVIRKKISGREFLTYPGFERISDPYFFGQFSTSAILLSRCIARVANAYATAMKRLENKKHFSERLIAHTEFHRHRRRYRPMVAARQHDTQA